MGCELSGLEDHFRILQVFLEMPFASNELLEWGPNLWKHSGTPKATHINMQMFKRACLEQPCDKCPSDSSGGAREIQHDHRFLPRLQPRRLRSWDKITALRSVQLARLGAASRPNTDQRETTGCPPLQYSNNFKLLSEGTVVSQRALR